MKLTRILPGLVFGGLVSFGVVLYATEDHPSALYKEYCAKCHGDDGKGDTPKGRQLMAQDFTDPDRRPFSLSADGMRMAYVARASLFVKDIGEGEPTLVRGPVEARGKSNPIFSPDGRSIVYWAQDDSVLERVPVTGGTPQRLARVDNPVGPELLRVVVKDAHAGSQAVAHDHGLDPKVLAADFFEGWDERGHIAAHDAGVDVPRRDTGGIEEVHEQDAVFIRQLFLLDPNAPGVGDGFAFEQANVDAGVSDIEREQHCAYRPDFGPFSWSRCRA